MRAYEVIVTEEDGTERRFGSGLECCKFYGFSDSALSHRINGMVKKEKRTFRYGKMLHKEPANKKKGKAKNTFNPNGYNVVPYEVEGTRVCKTQCTKMKDVKVGSYLCKRCINHRGQDRENHLVACEKKYGTKEKDLSGDRQAVSEAVV